MQSAFRVSEILLHNPHFLRPREIFQRRAFFGNRATGSQKIVCKEIAEDRIRVGRDPEVTKGWPKSIGMNTPLTKSQEQASRAIPPKRRTTPGSLPPAWRRLGLFLRSLPGHFSGRFIRPIIGFGFDVSGGIYRIDGCQFEIPVHLTDRNFRSAFVLGEYETGERKLIRRFLRADDRVIELGGCIGVLSCLVNARLSSRTHHLVVEANSELIPLLTRHRELNQACFQIEECAVSTEREVPFVIHRLMTHGRVFAPGDARLVRVRGRSLADLHYSRGPFNALLMDVEGSELEILRSSKDLLSSYRLVIIELHREPLGAEGLEECRRILTSIGLKRAAAIQSVEAGVRPELP